MALGVGLADQVAIGVIVVAVAIAQGVDHGFCFGCPTNSQDLPRRDIFSPEWSKIDLSQFFV
jgi:hypothetical protein